MTTDAENPPPEGALTESDKKISEQTSQSFLSLRLLVEIVIGLGAVVVIIVLSTKLAKNDNNEASSDAMANSVTPETARTFKMEGMPDELPHIGDLIEQSYPTWCIDENENRIEDVKICEDGTTNGKWSPLYFTKQFSGGDPSKGGYPTNIDIQYTFEFASPFFGQACAGSPHFCNEQFNGTAQNCKACPKLNTLNDNGPYGPGHVPPHIALAAVSRAYDENLDVVGSVEDWFDYEQNACRISPAVLLKLIRKYYPRGDDGKAYYPPPFSTAGGAYPLEFVNLVGESCEKEKAKHSQAGDLECFEHHSSGEEYPSNLEEGHGSPHYCTIEGKQADVNNDWCPYIYFGPNRGKYRHPHIAYSAVETYLANKIMPDKCGTTWDDSSYPADIDTTVAFPFMEEIVSGNGTIEQPAITDSGLWTWPNLEGTKKKPVVGPFATDLYIV